MPSLLRSASQLVNPFDRRFIGYGTGAGGGGFVGPLDSYTSSLSLALLPFRGFSTYAGDAFTIRDTSDDSEAALGFDATGALNTKTAAGNEAIKTWFDQSGNGNDISQTTAASQALLTRAVVNSQAVARFDGSDDEMSLAMSGGDARTVYVVCKMRATTDNARAFKDCTAGANADTYYSNATGKFYYYFTSPNVVDPVGGVGTNWSLVCLKYSGGTTCQPYVNGSTAEAAFGASAYAYAPAFGFVLGSGGGGSYGAVDIAARLVYDATHDDTTRGAIQTILAGQFGITLA